jgi:hypothetical protein
VVPQSAIVEFAGVEKVWKLIDGVAQEQPVRTARRGEKTVQIVGGLAAGDTILVDASQGQVARIDPIASEADAGLHAADSSSTTPVSRAAE